MNKAKIYSDIKDLMTHLKKVCVIHFNIPDKFFWVAVLPGNCQQQWLLCPLKLLVKFTLWLYESGQGANFIGFLTQDLPLIWSNIQLFELTWIKFTSITKDNHQNTFSATVFLSRHPLPPAAVLIKACRQLRMSWLVWVCTFFWFFFLLSSDDV